MVELSPVFILRRNPFRDHSLLLDVFSRDVGKFTCVAKFTQGKNSRAKGILEPFRLLEASWTGRGEVFSLHKAEEIRRYPLKQAGLMRAVYANELLLRTLWQQQPQPELFTTYQQTLQRLCDPTEVLALPQLELAVLANAGYELNLWHDDATGQAITPQQRYRFLPDHGLSPDHAEAKGVPLSGALLLGLREPQSLSPVLQLELRQVLDYLLQMLLNGKTLFARRLLP